MKDSDLLEVVRIEHHFWKTCPCSLCEEKREREDKQHPAETPVRYVSVETAYRLNLIASRCPEGSLARQLAIKPR